MQMTKLRYVTESLEEETLPPVGIIVIREYKQRANE